MLKLKNTLLAIAGVFIYGITTAQNNAVTNTGGIMDGSGKIYVVVAVLLTILIGLIFYLVRLDIKISKMEREG